MYEQSLHMLRKKHFHLLKSMHESLEFADAIDVLISIKREQKQMSALKALASAPHQEQLLKIRSEFAELEKASGETEEALKNRVLAQNQLCEQKREDALRMAEDAHAQGNMEAVRDALLLVEEAALKLPNEISLRRQLKCEVSDKSILPLQYLKPDDAKLRAVLNENKEALSIPGVNVFYETIVAVRTEGATNE